MTDDFGQVAAVVLARIDLNMKSNGLVESNFGIGIELCQEGFRSLRAQGRA